MTIKYSLTERMSGRVLREETMIGTTLIRVTNDLTSTERQAMPLLAQDAARRVVSQIAEGSW